MSKALAKYDTNTPISLLCPNKGCEGIELPAILEKEDQLTPQFAVLGKLKRFIWELNRPFKIFHLNPLNPCVCTNCQSRFTFVAIISSGNRFKTPLIIGYNSDIAQDIKLEDCSSPA